MQNLIKKDKLEELLISNWAKFIDASKLMSFISQNTKTYIKSFPIMTEYVNNKGFHITISRFQITHTGFIVWIDFSTVIEIYYAIGTTEILLKNNGDITHIQTIASLYPKK